MGVLLRYGSAEQTTVTATESSWFGSTAVFK
jgi:hypothetical protein